MKSKKRQYWRSYIEMCDRLRISYADAKSLISEKGEHEVGDFLLRVEGEIVVGKDKLLVVSLWKDGRCYFKSPVNAYLLEQP